MEVSTVSVRTALDRPSPVPVRRVHTVILGSGAAGLNAAVQLHAAGIEDLLIVSEGLSMGTSINTGSDKQTYYKLGMYGNEPDSPVSLAESLFAGGSMHGDLALVEAALSARAFLNLVNLGVPFPRDAWGQFVGYKTDHDPRQRATSVGPYTSKRMCEVLITETRRRNIPILENRHACSLLTLPDGNGKRTCGFVAYHPDAVENRVQEGFEAVLAENVVFAVGGPGGLYRSSVYPVVHTGAIGLALLAGARARSLPESQYGMASTRFRWNVSGTYMQVIPRFVSTGSDGISDEREFLRPYFASTGEMNSAIFLKGYQWPFDPRKASGGSSLIDILVYIETVQKGRRVFLDYRREGEGFRFEDLSSESYEYLRKSDALLATPIERLRKMNAPAISLYEDHGIHLVAEPLEIAVCAQHNNGGLAANHWWESLNIRHLFPVGEVNGSHGVYRPGGSALNAGQVAGFRVAEYIANRYRNFTFNWNEAETAATREIAGLSEWLERCRSASLDWREARDAFQARMSESAAHVRSAACLPNAVRSAWTQWAEICSKGCRFETVAEVVEALRNRHLCFAHGAYLDAVRHAVGSGVGSRGSALILDSGGDAVHPLLPEWRFTPEDPAFRERVLETSVQPDGTVAHEWVARQSVPDCSAWFETAWAHFREGRIYDENPI